jgi:hypothetical protein
MFAALYRSSPRLLRAGRLFKNFIDGIADKAAVLQVEQLEAANQVG